MRRILIIFVLAFGCDSEPANCDSAEATSGHDSTGMTEPSSGDGSSGVESTGEPMWACGDIAECYIAECRDEIQTWMTCGDLPGRAGIGGDCSQSFPDFYVEGDISLGKGAALEASIACTGKCGGLHGLAFEYAAWCMTGLAADVSDFYVNSYCPALALRCP